MIDGYSVNGRRLKMPMMEELSETQSFYCLYQLLVVIIEDWPWIKSNESHSRKDKKSLKSIARFLVFFKSKPNTTSDLVDLLG